MSKTPENKAAYYRERAMVVRTSADKAADPENRKILLRLAQAYDDLAERAEQDSQPKPRDEE